MKEKSPYGYVYLITNSANGKTYVGQRQWLKDNSWREYLGSGKLLQQALRKYPRDVFVKSFVVWGYSRSDLDSLEITAIAEQKSLGKAEYNIRRGGYFASEERPFTRKPSKTELESLLVDNTLFQISKLFKVSEYKVSLLAEEYGLHSRQTKTSFEEVADTVSKATLERLYLNEEIFAEEISEKLNISVGHVEKLLKYHHIPRRSNSENQKILWSRRRIIPSKEDLQHEVENFSSMAEMREKFSIPPREIRHYLEHYGIERPKVVKKEENRAGTRTGGRKSSHIRWHVQRGISKSGCEFCQPMV